jgi:hypothetical protein
MNSRTPAEIERLCKLLALLESPFAGERDAAALAIGRLVREHDLSWPQLLMPPTAEVRQRPMRGSWRLTVEDCLARRGALMPWQRQFLCSLRDFQRISLKQRAVLDDIATRVLGRRAA